jgi:hypothetical protein
MKTFTFNAIRIETGLASEKFKMFTKSFDEINLFQKLIVRHQLVQLSMHFVFLNVFQQN